MSKMILDFTKSTEEQLKSNERLKYHFNLDKKREVIWSRRFRTIAPLEIEKINWEENLEGKGFIIAKNEVLGKTKYSDTYQCKIKSGSFASNLIEKCLKEIQEADLASANSNPAATKSSKQSKPDSSPAKQTVEVIACKSVRIKGLSKTISTLFHKRNISIWFSLKNKSLLNYLKIYGTSSLDKYYLFIEYADQGILSKFLKANHPTGLPANKTIQFAVEILNGLHYLHSNGIAHRRLKADNLFVCDNGNQIKIGGLEYFSEICDVDHNNERAQCWMHHEHNGFNSIESISNDPHNPFHEDIFSFGCIFFFMLSNQLPFDSCKIMHKDPNHNCKEHRGSFKRNLTNQTWNKRENYKTKETDQIKTLLIGTFNMAPLVRPSTDELIVMEIFKK